MTPAPLQRLIVELAKLPGIGEKTAQRLAFHILRAPPAYARDLAGAIVEVIERVRLCPVCCALTESDDCPQCQDPKRDDRLICVVETVADMLALERTREFNGRYHVLHGVLSPLDGVGPEQLHIKETTLKYHNRNLYGKLGVASRKELMEVYKHLQSLRAKLEESKNVKTNE